MQQLVCRALNEPMNQQSLLVGVAAALLGSYAYIARRRSEFSVVLCTAPSREKGAELAQGLLQTHLAACINIVPAVESHYVWEGKVNVDKEAMLIIKTRAALVSNVTTWLLRHHPYDEPEVIALPIEAGSRGYLDWVASSTAAAALPTAT